MFGKFGKKKSDESKPETKSKQKNDLFTLLEENPSETAEPKVPYTQVKSQAPSQKDPVKAKPEPVKAKPEPVKA
ncbi:MAG: hypothetical protein ACE5Q4_02585, partial [Nitrosopumilus sp.]